MDCHKIRYTINHGKDAMHYQENDTMSKMIKIGTKSQADSVLVDSLFKAGGTLQTMRFDMGKYKADVSLIGREVQCGDDVYAVYQVSRRDQDGPYRALMCVCA